MEARSGLYHYTECGLPNVRLQGVGWQVCPDCGVRRVRIPSIGRLHDVIARTLVEKPARLTGPEFRFLRAWKGLSGRDAAELLARTPETISKWENEHRPADPMADIFLRVWALLGHTIDDYDTHDTGARRHSEEMADAAVRVMETLRNIARSDSAPARLRVRREDQEWSSELEAPHAA